MNLLEYIDCRKFKVLLFDLDGTLIDTSLGNAKAYQSALLNSGLSVDLITVMKSSEGKNWRQFLPELLLEFGSNIDPQIVAEKKQELYFSNSYNPTPNFELVGVIKSMHGKVKLGLVTTASNEAAMKGLNFLGVIEYFDVIVSSRDVEHFKPHPEPYIKALQILKLHSSEALVFEDTEVGICSALSAGISTIVKVDISSNSYQLLE